MKTWFFKYLNPLTLYDSFAYLGKIIAKGKRDIPHNIKTPRIQDVFIITFSLINWHKNIPFTGIK